ncbi:MAG: creatininase family protein [Candidatus Thermoplasmatota archaeon]|nr:creatininase family protein [Candidatus Sysuiplasma jiujiangense]MBX8639136.1 creatininase family protein [Candidatus Sysuiplasma jiujiangense]MBX8641469.1 creatininase family protein [Candidatus Sysuiplasma jiujiangense]MCL4317864.1 creatininase family protein [Candidatus Thermoplasmatota archaeon]MCL5254292.1 creatininase family protein [Candidatus Thermoplasmatota archaeon]
MTMLYEELNLKSFAERVKEDPVVFLPVGATEEHGSHLPLGSDTIQAREVCNLVAQRVNGIVLPALPYGVSTSLRDYPGTISISYQALYAVAKDILSELVRNGIRKIVVLSGHGAQTHMSALRSACEEVAESGDTKIILLCDYDIAYRLRGKQDIPPDDGHGGVIETSRVLAFRPSLVSDSRPKGKDQTPDFFIPRHKSRYMTEGIIGDSSKATANLGSQINMYVVEELVKAVNAVM